MLNYLNKRLYRHECGQALVATTCLIVALMGFAALATDIGYLYSVRRHMQTAADAAAVAAANQTNVSAATDVTALNGFTNGQNNTTVTVTPSINPSGYPAGTPQEALDCACGLYLGDTTAWLNPPPPTN